MPMQRDWGEDQSLNEPLIHIINKLELTAGLQFCLDAGDIESAPEAATSWLDRSGNGYDFFRGTNAGAQSNDPTFNGVPGNLSASEYWSFDGLDYFRYDTTTEAWMQNCHKDNAIFSIASWVCFANPLVTEGIIGDRGTASTTGFNFSKTSTDTLGLYVKNAGANGISVTTLTSVILELGWTFCGVTIDESIGVGGMTLQINGVQENGDSEYLTPATGPCSAQMEIGCQGGASFMFADTGKMGMIAMWEGTRLTPVQLDEVFQATRGRYGI